MTNRLNILAQISRQPSRKLAAVIGRGGSKSIASGDHSVSEKKKKFCNARTNQVRVQVNDASEGTMRRHFRGITAVSSLHERSTSVILRNARSLYEVCKFVFLHRAWKYRTAVNKQDPPDKKLNRRSEKIGWPVCVILGCAVNVTSLKRKIQWVPPEESVGFRPHTHSHIHANTLRNTPNGFPCTLWTLLRVPIAN